MKKWILVAVVVLVVGVAAPWATGKLTEQQWHAAANQLDTEASPVTLDSTQYERDWFGSDLSGRVTLRNPQTGEVVPVPYTGSVSHGWLGSEITLTPEVNDQELAQRLFPDEQPTVVISTSVWGTGRVDVTVPSIHVEDKETGESLNVSEAYGWAEFSDGGRDVKAHLSWPGLVVRAPGLRARLGNLQFDQDARRVAESLWAGEMDMTLDSLALESETQPDVVLSNLSLTGDTEASEGNETVRSDSTMTVESLKVADQATGPHRMTLTLDNLDVESWTRLMAVSRDVQQFQVRVANNPNPDVNQLRQQQMQLMQRFSQAAKGLAGAGIALQLKELSLETPQGTVSGHLSLSHPEVAPNKRDSMPLIMQQLTGKLDLSLPVALVKQVPRLERDAESLTRQGFLKRDGETYSVDASLKDMQVNLNGETIPVPPLI
ncbi:DUF945 family protein [Tamilnaduibacter salinus]|nr:DUF945 family protein [Tamilnaduibacter salinus]